MLSLINCHSDSPINEYLEVSLYNLLSAVSFFSNLKQVLVLFLGLGNVVINHSGFGMLDVMVNTYSVFKLTTKS